MGSCLSKAGAIVPPKVTIEQVKFRGINALSGISTDVHVVVTNPNPGSLEAITFRYTVCKKSDNTVLASDIGDPFTAPGRKATSVVVPVTFGYGGVGAAGKSLLLRGQTTLLVSGEIVFNAPWTKKGNVTVPFSGVEQIDVPSVDENVIGSQ